MASSASASTPVPASSVSGTPASTVPASMRRTYIDWLRGFAVVAMIEAHTFDSWTAVSERGALTYWYIQVIAGMAAPSFLFLAGVAVSLASGIKEWRGADSWEASRSMQRRGWQILGLAILFRIQSFIVSPGSKLWGILKVDILNVMGPAIACAALVWGLVRQPWRRFAALAAIAIACSLLTPIVRASTWFAVLPDPLEWYFQPRASRTNFTLFPWAGFVFAGAAVGLLLERTRDAREEVRLNLAFGLGGALLATAAYVGSLYPSIYSNSDFWTSSPSYFFLRLGLLTAGIGAAYLWMRRPTAQRYSPLVQFGRTSLFIYWIHVELVYGFISKPLHRSLTIPQACVAFVLFTALMLAASVWKTRLVRDWKNKRRSGPASGTASGTPMRPATPEQAAGAA